MLMLQGPFAKSTILPPYTQITMMSILLFNKATPAHSFPLMNSNDKQHPWKASNHPRHSSCTLRTSGAAQRKSPKSTQPPRQADVEFLPSCLFVIELLVLFPDLLSHSLPLALHLEHPCQDILRTRRRS